MAGTIRPNDMDVATTPTMSNATLPSLDGSASAKKPSAPRTPRIDVEPLYAGVKGAITDAEWATYKTSLSAFLLGNLNQDELSFKLARILRTPALERAHNALVAAIYGNMWRDAPEAGIASWVSSTDKPTSGTAKGQGDESEKRLKYEVMQLSRRERKRLKTIPPADVPMPDGVGALGAVGPTLEYVDARRVKQPEMGPTSTQGGYKTNWDLEIRKRYTSALYVETHEFPTATTISHRLLPTCYEFGLPQGHTADCPDYLNLATEAYIKEALMSLLAKVTSNGPGPTFIRTASFKRKCAREEALVDQGNLAKSAARELPVEAEVRRARRPMCMEDLRLALQLGDGYLGQSPFVAGTIANAKLLDTYGLEDVYPSPPLSEPTLLTAPVRAVGSAARKHPRWLADGLTVSFPDSSADATAGGGAGGPDTAMPDAADADAAVPVAAAWLGDTGPDGRVLDDALDEVLGLADL